MTNIASLQDRRAQLANNFPTWPSQTLDGLFFKQAEKYGDRPFIIGDDGITTYAELAEKIEFLAKGLIAQGIGFKDRVALLMPNYSTFPLVAFAAWRVGATVIPVNFAYQASELDYVLKQSKCCTLITPESFRDSNYLNMLDEVAPHWQTDLKQYYPAMERVICLQAARPNMLTVDALIQQGRDSQSPLPANPACANDPAVIMYTSGTTGQPKGVVQAHDQQLRNTYSTALHRGYEDGRRILFSLPLYHAFGLSVGLLGSLWVGGSVIMRPEFDPLDMLQHIAKYKATDILLVPTMAIAMVDHPDIKQYDLSSLFACLAGAAATPRRVWEKLQTGLDVSELVNGYGMTEMCGPMVMTAPGDSLDKNEKTIGYIMGAGVAGIAEWNHDIAQCRVIDPDTGADVAPEQEGELAWKTPLATQEYFEKPEATAELFTADGWLKSGDLGRLFTDGYIQVTGRAKDQYKSGGELVSPQEVEDVLSTHPDVAQAYVFGISDERWNEIGAAFVIPHAGTTPSAEELQALAKSKLAKYKWPRHIFFGSAEDLPKTATGKVQKFKLRDMAEIKLGLKS